MPFKVVIIESERGWGQKVDDVLYFENDIQAWEFERKYNAKNPPGPAPDWYMQAQDPEYIRELPEGAKYYEPPVDIEEWPIGR